MNQAEKKRKLILGAALVATLIAVVLVDDEEVTLDDLTHAIQPTQSTKSSTSRENTQEHLATYIDIDQLGVRQFNAQAGNLFGSTSWAPERPQITPQQQQAALMQQRMRQEKATPPAPTAPPLRFKYIGKAIAGNKTWVFLADNDENHVTRIGQKIDEQYRLDTINDEEVMFTYLPLDAKQTLAINDEAGGFR